jgi:hypothetical protein
MQPLPALQEHLAKITFPTGDRGRPAHAGSDNPLLPTSSTAEAKSTFNPSWQTITQDEIEQLLKL